MNEQLRTALIEVLNRPDTRVTWMRGIKEGPPKDGYATFKPGEALFVVLATGPDDPQFENAVMGALNHSPMNFRK